MQISVNFLREGMLVYRAADDHQKIQITIFVGLAAAVEPKSRMRWAVRSNDTADDFIHYAGPLGREFSFRS